MKRIHLSLIVFSLWIVNLTLNAVDSNWPAVAACFSCATYALIDVAREYNKNSNAY